MNPNPNNWPYGARCRCGKRWNGTAWVSPRLFPAITRSKQRGKAPRRH